MARDPDSGKYRRTRLFVMTLGCSRKCVRLLAFRSSARVWAELHEKAFRRLGGSPRVVVLGCRGLPYVRFKEWPVTNGQFELEWTLEGHATFPHRHIV
jgi:hypothetical protein